MGWPKGKKNPALGERNKKLWADMTSEQRFKKMSDAGYASGTREDRPKPSQKNLEAMWAARRGQPLSEEHKAAISAGSRAFWDNLSQEDRTILTASGVKASCEANPSNLERIVKDWLNELVSKHGQNYAYEHSAQIGSYTVDFLLANLSIIVECDGKYWHERPGRPEADAKRDLWLEDKGYRVVRLLEKDILQQQRNVELGLKGINEIEILAPIMATPLLTFNDVFERQKERSAKA